jgi:hypothetical protein
MAAGGGEVGIRYNSEGGGGSGGGGYLESKERREKKERVIGFFGSGYPFCFPLFSFLFIFRCMYLIFLYFLLLVGFFCIGPGWGKKMREG